MRVGYWVNLTADGVVKASPGSILGFYVNSTTGGTLRLHDHATAASNPMGGVITPAIGWNEYPMKFSAGLFADIENTLDVTFSVAPR